MNENEFNGIVDVGKYQIFLFKCPAAFPSSFASHPWIVTNQLGEINRWEVLKRRNLCETSWNHVHNNYFKPYEGIMMFPVGSFRFKGSLVGLIEGNADSLAAFMADFVTTQSFEYGFRDKYQLLGPNSNTFVQEILDEFPESGLELPFNSIGKKYLRKRN